MYMLSHCLEIRNALAKELSVHASR
jgi:hypothetical protein